MSIKWPLPTKCVQFVRYNRVFVITEFVITEFDCTSIRITDLDKPYHVFSGTGINLIMFKLCCDGLVVSLNFPQLHQLLQKMNISSNAVKSGSKIILSFRYSKFMTHSMWVSPNQHNVTVLLYHSKHIWKHYFLRHLIKKRNS